VLIPVWLAVLGIGYYLKTRAAGGSARAHSR
jgi:hypothetical protein